MDVMEKNQIILDTIQCLMCNSNTAKSMENLCLNKGYHNIIIYGYGVLGKAIWRDLKDSKVKVVAIMDSYPSSVDGAPKNIPVVGIDAEKPDYDAVMVTAVAAYNSIKEDLESRDYKNIFNAAEFIGHDTNELTVGKTGLTGYQQMKIQNAGGQSDSQKVNELKNTIEDLRKELAEVKKQYEYLKRNSGKAGKFLEERNILKEAIRILMEDEEV